jgi:hypothetical protein
MLYIVEFAVAVVVVAALAVFGIGCAWPIAGAILFAAGLITLLRMEARTGAAIFSAVYLIPTALTLAF